MSDRKKIIYLTTDSFIDVDLQFMESINSQTDLHWLVTFSDLSRSDHQVFSPDYIKAFCKSKGIKPNVLISNTRVRNPRRIYQDWKLTRWMVRQKADVIYFDGFPDYYFPVIAKLILGKRKTIVALHDIELHPGNVNIFHKFSQWLVLNLFRNFHVFSVTQKTLLLAKFPKKRVFRIGLYLKDFGKQGISYDMVGSPKKVNFLFFGRDYPYKGLDMLIRATNLLSASTKDFLVTIAGKCNDFDRFDEWITDRSLYNIRTEFIKSDDIPGLFEKADFVMLPYKQVTQSGPLMIAFNYLVPVIASDLDGFKEYIINNETGFLFPVNDYEKLAAIMGSVIKMSSEQRDQIRKNLSRFKEKEFQIENFTNEYIKMFNTIGERFLFTQ